MRRAWLLMGLIGLSGCLPFTEEQTLLVGGNPFNQPTQLGPLTQVNFSAASKETALRVDQAGQKLLQGNPQLKFRPLFATIGSPRLELFHTEGSQKTDAKSATPAATPVIYLTEGLVKRCPSEIELTAVLSYELARMLAERETSLSPEVRNPAKLPPIQVPIGNVSHAAASADMTGMAELAKFERTNPKSARNLPPPDPKKIAVALLDKAGYPDTALASIEPLLKEAEQNAALERQFKGGVLPTWSPE